MLVFVTVLVLSVLGTHAAPQSAQPLSGAQSDTPLVTVLTQTDSIGADGSFNNSFEASNGIKQQNTGFLKKVLIPQTREDGTATGDMVEGDILVQTGSYSYVAPDGTPIQITYVADENGFQPVGDHIPTPPAIPAQILDSLKKSAEEQQQSGGIQSQQSPSGISNAESNSIDIDSVLSTDESEDSLTKQESDDVQEPDPQGVDARLQE